MLGFHHKKTYVLYLVKPVPGFQSKSIKDTKKGMKA